LGEDASEPFAGVAVDVAGTDEGDVVAGKEGTGEGGEGGGGAGGGGVVYGF
jgi:hypothetical protein